MVCGGCRWYCYSCALLVMVLFWGVLLLLPLLLLSVLMLGLWDGVGRV